MGKRKQHKAEPADDRYTIDSWAGLKRWRCSACGEGYFSQERFEAHWQERHLPTPPPRAPTTLIITDRFGNPVEEREV
mgnify:CR=1 FL=1